jgi:hypothetical protein
MHIFKLRYHKKAALAISEGCYVIGRAFEPAWLLTIGYFYLH